MLKFKCEESALDALKPDCGYKELLKSVVDRIAAIHDSEAKIFTTYINALGAGRFKLVTTSKAVHLEIGRMELAFQVNLAMLISALLDEKDEHQILLQGRRDTAWLIVRTYDGGWVNYTVSEAH